MAIILPSHKLVIFEIPKTGTTWQREALTQCGTEWHDLQPITDMVCPRHSPPHCYNIPKDYQTVCAVRRPLAHLKSFYFYHKGKYLENIVPKRYYAHYHLWSTADTFEKYIQQLPPAPVSRIFDLFTPFCDHILHQETLSQEFNKLLNIDTSNTPPTNQSNRPTYMKNSFPQLEPELIRIERQYYA